MHISYGSCWPNFHLYSKQNLNSFKNLNSSKVLKLSFDFTKEVKLIIHGFSSDGNSKRITLIKDSILKNNDVNVIIIDWSEGAVAPDYITAKDNTKIVGKKISEFLFMNDINPSKVHCIGHSLGKNFFSDGAKIKFTQTFGTSLIGEL
ncbi:unnamed protein product [Brachionus calyciflorus]|uniref:Lipase domain-containing protein n=1 Tax=Brachionus calyciflorus TaxID=104777 RepID=A0A813PVN2_9BILA|nr:unnamed protein product [Brachionus calyciflorus]